MPPSRFYVIWKPLLFLPSQGDLTLTSFWDADWLGCSVTRRSKTTYLIMLGGSPISWKMKKQSVVSWSSTEAENQATATTVREVLWLWWLLEDFEAPQHEPTPLYCDNEASRYISTNPVFHERTKHVEIDIFFVRERVQSKEIQPTVTNFQHQITDKAAWMNEAFQISIGKIEHSGSSCSNLRGEWKDF